MGFAREREAREVRGVLRSGRAGTDALRQSPLSVAVGDFNGDGTPDLVAGGQAALTEPWSNGQVEGQVNRLKTIKRQMYGRAGMALLRARVRRKG